MNLTIAKLMRSSTKTGSTFDAGFWVLASQGVTHFLRLLTSILLTRLLAPDAFGLIAIAMTFITAIHMASDLGLRQIIVTSENSSSALFLDTVWSLQIIRGVLVFVIASFGATSLFFLSPWLGHANGGVYANPVLPFVFVSLGVSAIVLGFESTGTSVAVRDTKLRSMVWVDISTQVISALTTLVIAYFYRSVWPLVVGNLVGAIARVYLSRKLFTDHVNTFRLDRRYALEIFLFGKLIFASSVMGFLINNADKLAFSLVMSATKFGTVAIAISLLAVLLDTIHRLVDNVVFPKLKQAAQNGNFVNLADRFYQFRFWLESAIFFLVSFLWVASESIVQLLFDSRYQSAAQYLQVLSFTLFWLIASCCASLGLVLGNTRLLVTITWIRLVLTGIFPFIGFSYFGEIGIAWALVIAQVPAILYAEISSRRLLGIGNFNPKRLSALFFVPLGYLAGYLFPLALRFVR